MGKTVIFFFSGLLLLSVFSAALIGSIVRSEMDAYWNSYGLYSFLCKFVHIIRILEGVGAKWGWNQIVKFGLGRHSVYL